MNAFMWYLDNQCYFAMGSPDNTDPSTSGTCTIEGHANIGRDYHEADEIIWYFSSAPEHARKFTYQLGEWGPIAEMTDERYYIGGGDEFWLWEMPEGHCDVCGDVQDVSEEEEIVVPEEKETSEPSTTEIEGLADLVIYENSAKTFEEKCQIAQEFYWALLQILDRDNDGVMTLLEFE